MFGLLISIRPVPAAVWRVQLHAVSRCHVQRSCTPSRPDRPGWVTSLNRFDWIVLRTRPSRCRCRARCATTARSPPLTTRVRSCADLARIVVARMPMLVACVPLQSAMRARPARAARRECVCPAAPARSAASLAPPRANRPRYGVVRCKRCLGVTGSISHGLRRAALTVHRPVRVRR